MTFSSCSGAGHDHAPARLLSCPSCSAPVVSWHGRTLNAHQTGNLRGLRFECWSRTEHRCPSRADILPGMIRDAAEHGDFATCQTLLAELASLS